MRSADPAHESRQVSPTSWAAFAPHVTACHAGGSGKIDACKLVSAAEAGKILGTPVTVKHPVTYSTALCDYSTGHMGSGFMLKIHAIPYKDAAAELASQKKSNAADWPSSMGKLSFTDVKGLGEAATVFKAERLTELEVLAHGSSIVITMHRRPDNKAVAQAENSPASPPISNRGGKAQQSPAEVGIR